MVNYENTSNSAEPEPKIIGLTGGIGSGKSTVAKFIQEMGYPIYNSDYWAKELVNYDDDLRNRIKILLGDEAYDEAGLYNRKWVSEKVFENAELLQQLNLIIHPAVKLHFETWVSQQTSEFVFKETALLFELKLNESCYKSILVTAEDNIRMKRVMERDGKTYREVEAVIEKQMPEKDKMKLADFIIHNNTDLIELRFETEKLIQSLKEIEFMPD